MELLGNTEDNTNILSTIKEFMVLILFYVMLVIPRQLQTFKSIILAGIIVIFLMEILTKRKIKVSKNVLVFHMFFLMYSLLSSTIGVINNNPGAFGFLKLNFLYMLMLFPTILPFNNKKKIEKLFVVLIIASLTISIHTILTLLVELGYWPNELYIPFDATNNIMIHPGYIHIVNTNLSMSIILVPICFLILLYNKKHLRLQVINVILLSISVIISGRRILWIILIITLLTILIISQRKRKKIGVLNFIKYLTVLLVIAFILDYFELIEIKKIINRFTSVFKGEEGNIRYDQAKSLFNGFLHNPLLGSGAGVGTEYIRNEQSPWMYELSYNLILYNSGIIGMIFYILSFIVLVLSLYKYRYRNSVSLAFLLALVFAIVANATNPYFSSSFDFLIFLVIPIIGVNFVDEKKYIIRI